MKACIPVWAVTAVAAMLFCACSDHKIIKETSRSSGVKIDKQSVYLGWIGFGEEDDWYKHGYKNKEEWLGLIATLNQAYHGFVSKYDGARTPEQKPKDGQILVGVKDVRIPGGLRDGNREVTAVVYLEDVKTQKVLYEATVSLKADAWGFESALNQATYNLAIFVRKLVREF
jgi:hypothetical protein